MARIAFFILFISACDVYDTSLLVDGGSDVIVMNDAPADACTLVCSGACVDGTSDKNNCGACGTTCEVGCSNGYCTPTVLATSLGAPHGLVINNGSLYFANYNNFDIQVMSAVDGTGLKVFAGSQLFPSRLATDGTALFWTNDANAAHPASGQIDMESFVPTQCAPPLVDGGAPFYQCYNAQDLPGPWGIAAQGGRTFVTTTSATNNAGGGCPTDAWVNSVISCPVSGCDVTACATQFGPTVLAANQTALAGIAIDSTNIYWADTGANTVRFCPQPDCAGGPQAFAINITGPFDVVSDGTTVYFTDRAGKRVYACPKTGCGSTPTILANGVDDPFLIAVDSARVYFTLYANGAKGMGAIMSCALPTCAGGPTTHAVGLNGPYGIVVDSTYIYWTEEGTTGITSPDGRVSKLKKK